jgi:hypothetical protein
MRFISRFLAVSAITLMGISTAHAQYNASEGNAYNRAAASLKQDYVVPYIGYFDITQDDNSAAQFGVEYRFAPYYYTLRPAVGLNVSTDGSVYGYGGVFWDIDVMDGSIWLTPNFAAGLYHSGDGKSLGGAVEFRSGIELSYMLENQHRIGLAFNHISNASIYDRNPGAETLLLNYHLPMQSVFK